MKKSRFQMGKRTLSLALVLMVLLSLWVAPMTVHAAEPTIFEGELLLNPGFEDGNGTGGSSTADNWTKLVENKAGRQNNNKRTGSFGFYVDSGTSNGIKQAVVAPYNGYYVASGYISAGGTSGVLSVRTTEGAVLASKEIPVVGSTTNAYLALDPIELKQGDEVVVQVNGGGGWINGDDLSFQYADYRVDYNLVKGYDFTGDTTYSLFLPWAGSYAFTATATAGSEGMTVGFGDDSDTLAANETKTITLDGTTTAVGDSLSITVTGGSLADASLKFDVSGIANEPPVASDLAITHRRFDGELLVGSYTWSDPDEGQREGGSAYRWLASDTADGVYAAIEGETSNQYATSDAVEGKYFKFEVTPYDSLGLAGAPVISEPFGPFTINWVRNPSMDIEVSNAVVDWKTSGTGADMPNNAPNARTGFRVGRFTNTNTTGTIYYPLTTERTGIYKLSAWTKIQSGTGATTIGVRNALTKEVLGEKTITATTTYAQHTLDGIPIERNTSIEVYALGNSGSSYLYVDDFELIVDPTQPVPNFLNLLSFQVVGQVSAGVDAETHTITAKVPFDTDLAALKVNADFSDGATLTPAGGAPLERNTDTAVDFSGGPVAFVLANGDDSITWTVSVEVGKKMPALESSNTILEEGFNWAVNKTQQFVMTGRDDVPFEMWAGKASSGPISAQPSYWAGYYNRSAYYGRDFAHQASGAELVGLAEENYRMFEAFAKSSTESRKWYAVWALNFDNETPLGIDYKSDTNFVREVPAQFELVEKAYQQYLWSGDTRYLSDEMMTFYGHVMNEYVALHDSNGNGIAEGDPAGGGIFRGSATYNERGSHPLEAGDSIGSQYQATLAYAGFLLAAGDEDGYDTWMQKAADLKAYFNEDWSVKEGTDLYANILTIANVKEADFGKENSWFMPMKLITEPGERNEAYLDFISTNLGSGIGSSGAPNNIEAYTYIPDTFFAYNRSDEAWKWMKYIIGRKDLPHEVASQGTNGDYPEISYTFVSHTIEGMMGVEPDARLTQLSTVPRLPAEVDDLTLRYLSLGGNELTLTHDGNNKSTLTNDADNADTVTWIARFYGNYATIEVDGVAKAAAAGTLNGKAISYVELEVAPGETVTAETAATVPLTGVALDESTATLTVGGAGTASATFKVEATPADTTSDWFTVDWSSSNAAVATVEGGVVTPVGKGTATITATLRVDGVKYTPSATVTVIDKSALAGLIETCGAVYEVRCTPETWEPFATALGEAEAVLAGVAADQAEVDAAFDDLTAKYDALVDVPANVTGVTVSPETVTIDAGKTTTLTATVAPVYANDTSVSWSSSDEDVATVDSNGVVTGVWAGEATITATTTDGGITDTALITVCNVPPAGISLTPAVSTLLPGEKVTLMPAFTPATTTDKRVDYASDNVRVATVDAAGEVTAVAPGQATITATTRDGGLTATALVNVEPAPVPEPPAVSLSHTALVLEQNQYADITITTAGPEGTTWKVETRDVDVKPGSPLFTTQDMGNGVLRITASAANYGRAVLRVVCEQDASIFAECPVDVTDPNTRPEWTPYHLDPTKATVNAKSDVNTVLTLWRDTVEKHTVPAPLVDNELVFVAAANSPNAKQQAAADALNAAYKLVPLDDNRLELAPKVPEADLLKLASSYSVRIALDITYKGETERMVIPETLTLSINKKAPSVKAAKAVTINTFYDYRAAAVELAGYEIDTLALNTAKAKENAKLIGTDTAAGWLNADDLANHMLRVPAANANKGGTLYLVATLKGWSGSYPITVKVTAKPTAPQLAIAPASVAVVKDKALSAGATVTLQAKNGKTPLAGLNIVDVVAVPWGEITAAKDQRAYALNNNGPYMVSYHTATGAITLTTSGAEAKPGKLLLGAVVDGSDTLVRLPLTISTPASVTLTPMLNGKKAATVTLNAGITGGDEATITLKPNVADLDVAADALQPTVKDGANTYAGDDAGSPLKVEVNGLDVTISTVAGGVRDGASYTVNLKLGETATATVTVKTARANTTPTATLSATKLDLSTSATATVKASFKNYLGGYADAANLFTITAPDRDKTDVTAKFSIQRVSATEWMVTPTEALAAGKYKISATGKTEGGADVGKTREATLEVTASAPKVTLSTAKVTLYGNDRYCEGAFVLALPENAADISKVELKDAAKLNFKLVNLGEGRYAIAFKDAASAKAARKANLTLNVFLKGNANEAKPATTAKLSVTVIQFK